MPRAYSNWIEEFVDYGRAWFTSEFWLEWGAVWTIGTTVARQVWHEAAPGKHLFPNLYLMPVGAPGTGKGEVIEAIRSVLDPLDRFEFAPNSSTRAALIDYMKENFKARTINGELLAGHESIALNEELANLIPENDHWYLSTLNELYDCRSHFISRTRGHGIVELECPYASVFAAAQPQYLATTFPEQAWGMGFMSRTIMLYEGQQSRRRSLFESFAANERTQAKLTGDLDEMAHLTGKFTWDDEARKIIQKWYDKDMPPKPEHPRLIAYCNRRIMHLYKLCMVMSLAESNSLVICGRHVKNALELMFRTEARMPQIFLDMGGTAMSMAMQDVATIVRAYFAKYQQPLPESRVVQQLATRLPPNQLTSALNTMLTTGLIKSAASAAPGLRRFVPGTVDADQMDNLFKGEGNGAKAK